MQSCVQVPTEAKEDIKYSGALEPELWVVVGTYHGCLEPTLVLWVKGAVMAVSRNPKRNHKVSFLI